MKSMPALSTTVPPDDRFVLILDSSVEANHDSADIPSKYLYRFCCLPLPRFLDYGDTAYRSSGASRIFEKVAFYRFLGLLQGCCCP